MWWCTEKIVLWEDGDIFIFSHLWCSFNETNVVLTEHPSVIAKKKVATTFVGFQVNITY